uniref:Transposase Tc1-like domain-containing protein n=1 Tax=Paramormyrops kingsleyae TaxID=1676925 RepID=A0A3B3S5D0_9TELE
YLRNKIPSHSMLTIMKISKGLQISQTTVAKVIQKFKTEKPPEMSRPSMESAKAIESQARVIVSSDIPVHRKASLTFARTLVSKVKTIGTDETKVNVFGMDGEYDEKCMVLTVKHGGNVLLWGCVSAAGVGELHFTDGIRDSQICRKGR